MIVNKNKQHHTHDCINAQDIHGGKYNCVAQNSLYDDNLKKHNFLSEFETPDERARVLENLGIGGLTSGAARLIGEVDILPIDDVTIGDIYICDDVAYIAIDVSEHTVRWYHFDQNIKWQ